MKAFLTAAGYGTRLRPLTEYMAKAAVPVANRPLIHYVIDELKRNKISEFAVNVHYKPQTVRSATLSHLQVCEKDVYFSFEKKILGTAGGVKKCEHFFSESPFLIVNADVITRFCLQRMWDFHKKRKAEITLLLKKFPGFEKYGVLGTDKQGRLIKFLELSQTSDEIRECGMFAGVQIWETSVFNLIPSGRFSGSSETVYPKMIEQNRPVFGYFCENPWLDVGHVQGYLDTNFVVLDRLFSSYQKGGRLLKHGYLKATENGKILLGENTAFQGDSEFQGSCILGDDCIVGGDSRLQDTVIWSGCRVPERSILKNCVVMPPFRVVAP